MRNQKILAYLFFISLLSLPLVCGAVIGAADVAPITKVLKNVADAGILIVASICTIMIVWGGVMMLTASGDAEKVKSARQIILWAIIGLIVALMAGAITLVIGKLV